MCGIAGIVRFDEHRLDRRRLSRMLGHIAHRGPDGDGVCEHGRCSLVHSRLSIIDLLSGAQPMHVPQRDSDGPLHLVFNGEIYNHRYLRQKLERRGHVFQSDHSDTEVLLFGYREWGSELPKHLAGMFAFAVWDEQSGELCLARDRAGKKPLYLRWSEGELMFASLVGTLLMGLPEGESPRLDNQAMLTFLRFGYPFRQSMLEGVEELPPAHCMRVQRDGTHTLERYWQPPPISRSSTSIGAVAGLREVLTESVSDRLEADVPLGCFLSGGIDSSVVAALAQQSLSDRGADALRTFSVAMPDIAYDESAHAKAVADHIGAVHTVLEARVDDAMADLERLMAIMGEPTADSSLLPSYWLCRTARQHVAVALSGDGGDELFGGYDRYRAVRLLQSHRWWMSLVPTGLLNTTNPKATSTRIARLAAAASAGSDPAAQYQSMVHLFSEAQIRQLGIDGVSDQAVAGVPACPDWPNGENRTHSAMRWDLEHYLPFELLRKVDRSSMAVPLEVRCPVLDRQVMDLAGHLPPHVLMPGGRSKGLLRAVAADLLPPDIVARPKMGFAIPIGGWFRAGLKDALADRLFDGSLDDLGIGRTEAQRYFDEHVAATADHTHRLFALLQLSLWSRWLKKPYSVRRLSETDE